jgi:hypothetical protein
LTAKAPYKRALLTAANTMAAPDALSSPAERLDFDAPLPRKRGGKARPDLAGGGGGGGGGGGTETPARPAAVGMTWDAAVAAGGGAAGAAGGGGASSAGAAAAALKHIMFVGQLPYDATVPLIVVCAYFLY